MVKKYIIMAGGNYKRWETPRHLTKILGETIIERTIRLLRENGIEDISISTNNPVFKQFGVPLLSHINSYDIDSDSGKWYDAFYLTDEPVCYIFGDVVFSPEAIETIVNIDTNDIELFGATPPFASNYIKNHIEAFALKVVNTKHLKDAIEKTKEIEAQGKFWRKPLIWELWTIIKDVPLQKSADDEYIYNYTSINDYTCDIDWKGDIVKILKMIGGLDMVKCEVIEDFTLAKFDDLKNIERARNDTYGRLYVGDKFECDESMASYLTGNNHFNKVVVKVIGVIPVEVKPKNAEYVTISKKTKKRSKK